MRYGTLLASICTSGKFNVCGPNVPRGVRTSAKSEGDLFKETKISRQAQMEAAHEAPEE
jgi:hypothetical protein